MLRLLGSLLVAAVLALALVGCGSSDGGDPTRDSRLVGVWQITSATGGGMILPLADAMGWDEGTTRETVEFLANGAVVLRPYDGDTLVDTETGAWTAQAGAGTLTFPLGDRGRSEDVETIPFTYTLAPATGTAWLLDITITLEGVTLTREARVSANTLTLRLVKAATPTGNDVALVGAWRVLDIVADGAMVPLASYFDFPCGGADTMTVQFLADGTHVVRVQDSDEVVDAETGVWATGGPTVRLTLGDTVLRGIWENVGALSRTPSADVRFTFADDEGRTVQMGLLRWGAGGGSAALVANWQAVTATVNGEAVALADFFEWDDPAINAMTLQFWADGTVENKELAGSTPVNTWFGAWTASGANLTLTFGGDVIPGTFAVSGNTLTFTLQQGDDTIVLTFTRL